MGSRRTYLFPGSLPLAEGAGKLRAEQFRAQRIQIRPYLQQDKACFIRIAAASPLADHVLPLVRRGADYQHIAEALRGKVPRGIPGNPAGAYIRVMLHGSPALFQVEVMHPLACRQDLIRHHKIGLPRIIAVLQRGADKLDLVLVPGDLRQETPAGTHNRHRDNRKLLYGGVRQRGDPFDRIGSIGFLIKGQKVIHGMDRMTRCVSLAANTMFFSASCTAVQFKILVSI